MTKQYSAEDPLLHLHVFDGRHEGCLPYLGYGKQRNQVSRQYTERQFLDWVPVVGPCDTFIIRLFI